MDNMSECQEISNLDRMSKQLAKFMGKVQAAEKRNDTSYRSIMKHFRLLDVSRRHDDYIFDVMQVLYDGVPADEERHYSDRELCSFIAALKIYALGYGTSNRSPHADKPRDGQPYPDSFATACGKYAYSTGNKDWTSSRISAFLESKNLASNFKSIENIANRMGKEGKYRFDHVKLLRDLVFMFSNNEFGKDVKKQWAEQYVRSINKEVSKFVNDERNQ